MKDGDTMIKAVICDFETTGLLKPKRAPITQQPYIIEVGIYRTDTQKAISQLINPGKPLPPKITKITGITDGDLKDKPSFIEFFPEIVGIFSGTDYFIAHNAPFDKGVLFHNLARTTCDNFPWPKHTICTVQQYKHILGKWPKLTELYAATFQRPLQQTHRALDDVMALYEILTEKKFFEKLEKA